MHIALNVLKIFISKKEIYFESITFEEGVERIGRNMFNYCFALENISLPDSLLEIGDYVFVKASNLDEVRFGNGLRKIGLRVFLDAKS